MSNASEQCRIARAASVVGLATLASRVGGFVRDLVIAYFFGAGPAADAFFVAFRIPNLLRRLFAEGTLTISFIPVFTEVLAQKGKEKALLLARSTYGLLGLILLAVCALGMTFPSQVVHVMAPGFLPGSPVHDMSVILTRWCFPYIFFVSLAALAAAVLNSMDHFFAPAASPVLLNFFLIMCPVLLSSRLDQPVLSLGVGVLLGGAAQLLLQAPYLRARGISLLPAWDLQNPHLHRIVRLMGPAIFGAAVYQVTVAINTILASYLPKGSVSYLYYADRLIEFPLGIFAIAVSTAILPSLSRQASQGDHQALKQTMTYGLRLTMFINLPAMVGLIVLAEPLVLLLFARGQFDEHSARATAQVLVGYGLGLWAFAAVRSVLPAFYALKDTTTPVKVAGVCLVINLGVSLALIGPLAHVGLALATTVSGAMNFLVLLWCLRQRLGLLGGRELLHSSLRMALASAVMGLAVWLVAYGPDWGHSDGYLRRGVRPLAGMAAGAGVYLLSARLLGIKELGETWQLIRRRRS
ncbi:putative lipid II flippase MurJ [Desulfarculales bacterium]